MPIVSIAINDSFHAESSLFRLKRQTILHVIPGSTLLGRRVALYCNVPVTDKGEFIRSQYVHLNWFNRNGKKLTDEYQPHVEITELDLYCEIAINRSGTFHFYFTYDGSDPTARQGSFYIQIEPNITVGPDGNKQTIPLDAIRCQTVLSKCLGPLSTWENKLLVSKNSGYNVVHFTPIQELGASRSGYSISNQHRVNPEFSDPPKSSGKTATAPTFNDLDKVIKKIRNNWRIASICDIVLNHIANESQWIQEHPEASYSCFSCPYLRPAFLLDALLTQVGVDTKAGHLEMVGVPQIVETEDHLQALKYQLHTVYPRPSNKY